MNRISIAGYAPIDRRRIVWALFFCSGMPALIYQLTWQRALFRIFGINIESETIIVTAFMIGLGIGSLVGGWLSARRGLSLLLVLAVIEGLIGAFGIISLALFDYVGGLTIHLPLSGMALVVMAVIVVPTLLMGATLPVLVGHLVRDDRNVGATVGQLYYVNTLGAGAACFLAVVALFPFLGMQKSVYLAAAMNLCVAAGALLAWLTIWRRGAREYHATDDALSSFHEASTHANHFDVISPFLGLALSFLCGLIGLSYEILFLHTMSFASSGTAATFAVTLAAFLIGLAGGARRSADLCRSGADAPKIHYFILRNLVLATFVAIAFLPALLPVAGVNRLVQATIILLVYLFARYWGAFFPFLTHRAISPDNRAGRHLSYLYLANLLGAAVGSVVTGFILMDIFTLQHLAAVLALGCLGFAALASKVLAPSNGLKQSRLVWGGVVLMYGLVFATPLLNPLIDAIQPNKKAALVAIVENRSGIITVDRDRYVYGNGVYDGQFNIDLVHDTNGVRRAYALELYHPAPHHVLMIGMSSGSWAQIVANAPDVESLTIVEINPGYVQLIAADPDNASLLSNPKVKVIIDDGRRWLRRNPDPLFDAIISNTSFHYRANASNVLSAEFMQLIRQHLKPGGTFFYNTTGSQRAMRTGCSNFAHGARLDNFIIASDQPLQIDAQRWDRALLAWHINGKPVLDISRPQDRAVLAYELKLATDITDPSLVGDEKALEDCSSILSRTADLQAISDDNMGTEWRYSLHLDR